MANNGDAITPDVPLRTIVDAIAPPIGSTERTRLGEELPVFCERCGYSLHGLAQTRCETCEVLHFTCPECGHHQPINTLRPAFQRILGRMRALGLAVIMFLKINFFFWILFAWAGMGTEIAYRFNYGSPGGGRYGPTPYATEIAVMLFVLAFFFAAVARMLLLRWRSGVLIAMTLGGLVILALTLGAYMQRTMHYPPLPSPITVTFVEYLTCAFIGASLGGTVVWAIWTALAYAFLPKKTAVALLEWQRAMSARPDAPARSDATTSVTA